nr:hypothetical protein A5881_000711 [Enterococcus termitis]
MKKISNLFIAAMLLLQPVIGFASEDIAEEQKENGTSTQQFDKIGETPTYPMNNADGTVQFLDQTWDIIKDYGDGNKMIAMQNKIADSHFNPEFYFNTNDDNSNGYQDSVVKSIVDGWYNDNISGTIYEEFVQPVTLSNPTLGPIKQTYGWSSNTDITGSIGYTPWVTTILAPDQYPTIVGSGEKQAFLMSGSDVTKDSSSKGLKDAVIKHRDKLSDNGITNSWLSTVGGYSNFASSLTSGHPEVTNYKVENAYSVVPSLVVQSYDKAAPVTVKYQDEKGNTLSDDVILDGGVGLPYQSTAASISGWTLKETPANASGTFTAVSYTHLDVYKRQTEYLLQTNSYIWSYVCSFLFFLNYANFLNNFNKVIIQFLNPFVIEND